MLRVKVWLPIGLLSLLLLLPHTSANIKFPIIGDWGDDRETGVEDQKRVADQLATWCDENPCDFIFSMGDNFYPRGVLSVDDSRFDSSWKYVYNQTSLVDKTWYISIGNHDHDDYDEVTPPGDGREWNQVLYGLVEPRWVFPNRWYDFVVQDPAGFSIHFVVIDTMSIIENIHDPAAQLQWLNETLVASTSEWRVVVAHHPPYTTGKHGPINEPIDEQVVPILKYNKVQLLLCGHDHNLQHIQNATNVNEIDYVISGGGGRGLHAYNPDSATVLINQGLVIKLFAYVHGFVDLEFTADTVTAQYFDVNGTLAYSFSRGRSTEKAHQADV